MFQIEKIVASFKKNWSRKDLLLVFLLIGLYSLTRLINLKILPIFSDEGIYIHWAKVAWHDANWRFISLTDGKQPLQTWATIPLLKFFPNNMLLAGRLLAVFSGFFALSGIFTLLTFLFGKKSAFIGSFLYIFTPYFLFYDRIALVDSAVNGFAVWILFLIIVLARKRRLDIALILGLAGGVGLLAKSSVRIFFFLGFFAPLLFYERKEKLSRLALKKLNYYLLFGLGSLIALVIYNIQRLSPFFHFVSQKNKTFILTFDELLRSPFQVFFLNLKRIPAYVFGEGWYLMPILGLIGLIVLYRDKRRGNRQLAAFLGVCLLLAYIGVSFVTRVLFPRYIIFFAAFLLIPAAYLIARIKKTANILLVLGAILIVNGYFNYSILFRPAQIPFPPIDRGQYIEAWPAGWGMDKVVNYLNNQAEKDKVLVLADGNFGMSGDVLDVLRGEKGKFNIAAYWPLTRERVIDSQKLLKKEKVFLVWTHDNKEPPADWPIKLISRFDKPGRKATIYLFKVEKK